MQQHHTARKYGMYLHKAQPADIRIDLVTQMWSCPLQQALHTCDGKPMMRLHYGQVSSGPALVQHRSANPLPSFNTVEPLYSEHHWDPAGCPIQRGVYNSEVDLYTALCFGLQTVSSLSVLCRGSTAYTLCTSVLIHIPYHTAQCGHTPANQSGIP